MNWDDYRTVLALARTGSPSRAGATLGVARTTVTRRIDAAEVDLGVEVFVRSADGWRPTEAGDELIRAAERVEDELLAAEARVMGHDARLQGDLRVSTLDFVHEIWAHVFGAFVERYPGVRLTVSATTEQVSLRRREADVVLRLNDTPPADWLGRRLVRMAFAPYAARALVDRVGADAPLSAFPWLADDDRGPSAPWTDGWLARHAPGARIVMRYDVYAVGRAAIEAGVGVHLLPTRYADARLDLVRLAPDLEPITRDLWALTLPELRANPRVRAFMDHVAETLHDPASFAQRPKPPPTG